MPSAEIEPTIPALERPQTRAFNRTATGTGLKGITSPLFRVRWRHTGDRVEQNVNSKLPDCM